MTFREPLHRLNPFLWLGMRTGLAIVLAMGISLSMDWQKPEWAGIAVMSISQDSGAATLGKGILRVLATIGAGVAALTLIALFPQDRWGFFLGLSIYMGFCGYHMLASRHGYAWRVAGYVCPVIAISAGGADGVNDFATAIERLLENLTGITSIVLIGLAARPRGNREAFEAHVRDLAGRLAQLLGKPEAPGHADETGTPAGQDPEVTMRDGLGRFEGVLQPAIDESFRIRQQRHTWRLVRERFRQLIDQIHCWRLTMLLLSRRFGSGALAAHHAAAEHLQRRWQELGAAAAGQSEVSRVEEATGAPSAVEAAAAEPGPVPGGSLSDADRAVLILASDQWRRIDRSSTALERLLMRLRQDPRDQPLAAVRLDSPWVLNPDRLQVAIRLALGLWIAALLWMFVPDLPGGAGLITLTAVFSFVLALAGAQVQQLLPVVLLSLVPAGLLYVFVLPRLEGYLQLAMLLFGYTVAVFLIFGRKRPYRTLAIDFLLISFGITNQQSYNFVGFIDRTLAIILSCGIIAVLQEIPWSSDPKRRFLEGLQRLRRTVTALSLWLSRPPAPGHPLGRMIRHHRLNFLKQELAELPDRLEHISRRLRPDSFGSSAQTIAAMNEAARAIALWTRELERICADPKARGVIVEAAAAMGGVGSRPSPQKEEHPWHRHHRLMLAIEAKALRDLPEAPAEQVSAERERTLHALAAVSRGLADSMATLPAATTAVP